MTKSLSIITVKILKITNLPYNQSYSIYVNYVVHWCVKITVILDSKRQTKMSYISENEHLT